MILLDDVVQKFRLSEVGKAPEVSTQFHGFDRSRVGGILVDCNGPRIDRMWLPQGLAEEALGGRCIPLGLPAAAINELLMNWVLSSSAGMARAS